VNDRLILAANNATGEDHTGAWIGFVLMVGLVAFFIWRMSKD
jgi:hypothetical protein